MSVTRITRLNAGRTGDYTDTSVRTYQQTFRVETNNALDGPLTAEIAVAQYYGITQYRTPYTEPDAVDLGALVESIHGEPEDEEFPCQFLVHVTYSSRIWDELAKRGGTPPAAGAGGGQGGSGTGEGSTSPTDNPLLAPANVRYDWQDSTKAMETDLDGIHILNSAGERFSPPVEVPEGILVVTINTNIKSYNPLSYMRYYNAINQVPFLGFEKFMVLCKGITAERAYWNLVKYYKVTSVFHIWTRVLNLLPRGNQLEARLTGWQINEAPLDHGQNERKVGAVKRTPIVRSVPVTDCLLDGGGLDAGESGNPVYLLSAGAPFSTGKFRLYKRADFNDLYPNGV